MNDKKLNLYKNLIWLYILLFIFEGALRKWFLPSFSGPLLLIREPIIIYLVIVGLAKGWITNWYAKILMFISSICLLLTLFVGHQNLLIGLYGWHIYFFHFPFIAIASKILNKEDVIRLGRLLLYISIPITIIIIVQFYSPQSAWINLGVGGDTEGAGFGGALGFYRPSGTFSFTSGYVGFQAMICPFLLFFLLQNTQLPLYLKINKYILFLCTFCYILSLPYSISRTLMFTSIIISFWGVIAILKNKKSVFSFASSIIILLIAFFIANYFNLFGDSINAFLQRFSDASESEGGLKGTIGNRYLGGFINSLFMDAPFWGYGLGLGTNAGASLLNGDMFTFFDAEAGFGLIIGECGLLMGIIIIILRFSWGISLFKKGFKQKSYNLLGWLLLPNALLSIMTGPIGSMPMLGVLTINTFLVMAVQNKYKF